MDIRRCSFVVALLLLPSLAHADRHRADAAATYYTTSGGSVMKGFRSSFSVPVFQDCKEVSLVGEVSRLTSEDNGTKFVLPVYLVGFRYTFGDFGPSYPAPAPTPGNPAPKPLCATHPHSTKKKLIWFVQGLVGVTERTATMTTGTTTSTHKEPVRPAAAATIACEGMGHSWFRLRLQGDLLAYKREGKTQFGVGVSIGIAVGEATLKLR
jgi:hypothetical protein